jgi:hypothetical protein
MVNGDRITRSHLTIVKETTDDADRLQCGHCRVIFAVDDPVDLAEQEWWLCSTCVVASLGGGSLQRPAVPSDGSLTGPLVFAR